MGTLLNRRRYMGGGSADEIIMTSETNPEVLAVCYAQGWCASSEFMTKREAEAVTNIGTAFRSNTSITHFEEFKYFTGVTQLALYAFQNANNLSLIELPDSLISISNQAFQNTSITSIIITKNVRTFGALLFGGVDLESIRVVEENPYVDSRGGCNAIINSSTNVLYYGCKNTVIPDGVVSINSYAFSCLGVSSMVIPSGVISIIGAFESCRDLEEVSLPEGLEIIGNSAFRGCTKLKHINMPTSITVLGNFACFYWYVFEGELYFPNVTTVGEQCFVRDYSIKSLHFGDKLTSIGYAAFVSMSSLDKIVIETTEPPTLNNTNVFQGTNQCPIYVPDASVEAYKSAPIWSNYADRIKGISEL